jgi:hypothetical protein
MIVRANRIIQTLIVVFVLLTTPPASAGKIIYVDDDGPADFNNIQDAIDESSHGDTIIVAEGRYFENINLNGRNITLTSTDPCNPDVVAATIIDGSQNGSVVTFNNGEDANCILNGFTITNGHAGSGGGIYCGWPPLPPDPPPPPPLPPPPPPPPGPWLPATLREQSSTEIPSETKFTTPKITNCIIINNSADIGGGMYNNSNPALKNCTFSNNSADSGGGMLNSENRPTLTNCTFNGNSAGLGGGMYSFYSSPILTGCAFRGNSSVEAGGGMYCYESTPILKNCEFSTNKAEFLGIIYYTFYKYPLGFGGGMYNDQSSPALTNCSFNENSAYHGGGMYNDHTTLTLTNCTITDNFATGGLDLRKEGNGGGIYNYHSNSNLLRQRWRNLQSQQ